jgi:hypothetical protein
MQQQNLWKKQYKGVPRMQQMGIGNSRTHNITKQNLNTIPLQDTDPLYI